MDRFFAKATVCRAASVVLLSSAAWIITGCAAGYTVAPDNSSTTGTLSIRGNAHGGQQGIAAGSVQLWTVGTTGYGSAATSLLTTAVTTSDGTGTADSNANAGNVLNTLETGGFTLTGDYTCTGATYVYLTVTGGNAGGGTNSNIKLVTPLGLCSTLLTNATTTFINVDEVTTAATAFALGQYFNSSSSGIAISDNIGSPSTTQALVGLANAFGTVNSLVNTGTGAAVTSFVNNNATYGNVTGTPEASKLYLIADILATCVNSGAADNDGSGGTFSSTACATLYGAVAPTTGTTPVDTLEAAVEMSLNPTSNNSNTSATNLTTLFGLQTPQSPYIGSAQSTQPADWTVGILYTTPSTGTQANAALYDPQDLAIDGSGNVWIVNVNSKNDNVAEMSPLGVPQALVSSTTTQQYRNIAIDTLGNVFYPTTSSPSGVYEYKGSGSPTEATTLSSANGIAVNGSNDIFEAHNSTTACTASTAAFGVYTADTLTAANAVGFACPSLAAYTYEYMAVDASNNVWISDETGTSGPGLTGITEVNVPSDASLATSCSGDTAGCLPNTTPPSPTLTYNVITGGTGSIPALSTPFGIAVGLGGSNIWLDNQAGNTLTELTSTTAGTNFGSSTSLNKPNLLAVDGAGNIWVSNANGTSVSEFSSTGTVLSPASATAANIGYVHAGINTAYGIGIDPSGNVWIANNVVGSGVFELVGAGVPTVTPIASALAGTVGSTGHGIGQRP